MLRSIPRPSSGSRFGKLAHGLVATIARMHKYSRVRGGHTETLERMFHEPNKQLGATMGVVATRLSARNASRCCN